MLVALTGLTLHSTAAATAPMTVAVHQFPEADAVKTKSLNLQFLPDPQHAKRVSVFHREAQTAKMSRKANYYDNAVM